MNRVVLVDADERSRRAAARLLRQQGSDVVEADEEQALALFRDGTDATVVWNAKDAAGVTRFISALEPDVRSPVWLLTAARNHRDSDASGPPLPPVSAMRPLLGTAAAPWPQSERVELVGETTGMRDVRAQIRRLARHPRLHVLVGGEIGTGKQTFARALHAATGVGTFVHALPSRLTELVDANFGEVAELGGTLYVPSIADVPRGEQLRLAELMHEREVRSGAAPIRLVVGLRLRPQSLLERARRDDVEVTLASRLSGLVELGPLRRRTSDVALLVRHFLDSRATNDGAASRLAEPALHRLQQHDWPGNVRELKNVVEHAALVAGELIELGHLPAFPADEPGIAFELPKNGVDLGELERVVLEQALSRSRGNQTRAASLLGLTRDQIRYRMNKFGMARAAAARGEHSAE